MSGLDHTIFLDRFNKYISLCLLELIHLLWVHFMVSSQKGLTFECGADVESKEAAHGKTAEGEDVMVSESLVEHHSYKMCHLQLNLEEVMS